MHARTSLTKPIKLVYIHYTISPLFLFLSFMNLSRSSMQHAIHNFYIDFFSYFLNILASRVSNFIISFHHELHSKYLYSFCVEYLLDHLMTISLKFHICYSFTHINTVYLINSFLLFCVIAFFISIPEKIEYIFSCRSTHQMCNK